MKKSFFLSTEHLKSIIFCSYTSNKNSSTSILIKQITNYQDTIFQYNCDVEYANSHHNSPVQPVHPQSEVLGVAVVTLGQHQVVHGLAELGAQVARLQPYLVVAVVPFLSIGFLLFKGS